MSSPRRIGVPATAAPERDGVVVDLAFVAVLGLLATVGFRTVYGGWSWLIAGGSGLAAGMVLGAVGARRRLDALLVGVAALVVYFALSGVAITDAAIAGVVPTAATARGAATGAIRGWAELLTTVPPVGHLGNLGVVPLMCGLVGGLLAVSAALRTVGIVRPLLPLLGIEVVTILFGTAEPAGLVLQGAAFAAVAIAWVAYRRRGTRVSATPTIGAGRAVGSVLMVTLAALIATVAGDRLPGAMTHERFILRELADPPFDPKQQPSPLASFARYKSDREDIRGLRERVLFRVDGLPQGVPLRLAVMDTYDGVVWKVAGGADGSNSSSGVFERVGVTIPADPRADLPAATGTARVQITVEDYDDIWLPDLGAVTGLSFGGPRADRLAEQVRFNRTTHVGAVPLRFTKGDRIVVDAAWSVPPVQGAPNHPYAGGVAGAADVGGVERVADGLVELAERIVASGPRASSVVPDPSGAAAEAEAEAEAVAPGFDSVLRVAEEFVVSPGYGYSDGRVAEGEPPSVSGHSQRRMATFADDALRTGLAFGNDEQYASVLGLVARELDMPSRVVMGFCRQGCAGGTVTGKDVSAWIEVNVDGVGWVPLDPTPSADKENLAPVRPRPKPKPKNASQPPPPPVTVPPPEQLVADDAPSEERDADRDSILSGPLFTWVVAAGSPLLLVGGFVGGILALKRRRRRRRRGGDPMSQIVGGWEELDDRALDLGVPLPPRSTRREIATFLGSDAAWHSAAVADAAIWGPTLPSDAEIDAYWTSLDETYAAMASEHGGMRRLRADLNPASLVRAARRGMPRRRPRRRGADGEVPDEPARRGGDAAEKEPVVV